MMTPFSSRFFRTQKICQPKSFQGVLSGAPPKGSYRGGTPHKGHIKTSLRVLGLYEVCMGLFSGYSADNYPLAGFLEN